MKKCGVTADLCVTYGNPMCEVLSTVTCRMNWMCIRLHTTCSGKVVKHHSTVTFLFEMGFPTQYSNLH